METPESTQSTRRNKSDARWRAIIIALFALGLIVAVVFPFLNGNWRSGLSAIPIFAFAILIAAIRSIRPWR